MGANTEARNSALQLSVYLTEVKPLTLASKVKSLALKPLVLENCPVLGSRTTLFFELLKVCEALEKIFGEHFRL